MGIHDPDAAAGDATRHDAIRDANAELARLTVYWMRHVPGGSEKPAGFDARNPADPNYDWTTVDAFVRAAAGRGVEPFITTLEAPAWAEGDDAADRANRFGPRGTYDVNAREYRDFMTALATRYSGSFKDAAGSPLPRVRYWQMWNEPNFAQYLVARKKQDIPVVYVRLLNAGYDAVKAVSKSNVVLSAGLGPFGNNGAASDVDPQIFMRSVLCLTGKGGRNLRDKRRCKAPKPKFDVWTQHPYTFGGTPTSKGGSPDSAALGNMPDVKRTLDYAAKVGNVAPRGRKKLWISEFAWFSNPPGIKAGNGRELGAPLGRHAAYLSETAYRAWRLRFEALVWFGLDDQSYPFPSGLYLGRFPGASATPKPALTAFKFPFYADAQGSRVLVWGLVSRGGKSTVRIEKKAGRRWKRVADVSSDKQGMIYTRLVGGKGTYRARALSGQKSGLESLPFKAR